MVDPCGTTRILSLHRQMLRDEEFYSDPYEFNPDRFISPTDTSDRKIDSTELSASAGDPKSIVFGFGRRSESQRHLSLGGHRHCDNRICPGLHLADSTIWLTIACVLASFDILPPVDPKTGDVMVPEGKFVSGFTVYVHSSCRRTAYSTEAHPCLVLLVLFLF